MLFVVEEQSKGHLVLILEVYFVEIIAEKESNFEQQLPAYLCIEEVRGNQG